ncbi:hypothetical protein EI555_008268 [Monodon monoceros]|uniref:Uncharacterized protein n=1 Tax=Monodon monoceros TaxID=40151 RepID=A0A4V5P8L9_MONMO|nr:hypothetical protein EI555_008268 [Monodon monoceros]
MLVQERICDDELILIKNTKARTSASFILLGANDFMCGKMEHSLPDAVCVVRVLESKSVGPDYATSMGSREQLALPSLQDLFLLFLMPWPLMLPKTPQIGLQNWIGLDLVNDKVKSLKFATEPAITILRIDLIKLHPEDKDDKHGGYEAAVHSGALDD